MADELPFFKFFPNDWLSDEKLRLCSRAARGTWQDMLCLMWKAKRRGYLENAAGAPLTAEQLARVIGCTPKEITADLAELESAGVYSREDGSNVIFSRRLVRDANFREVCSRAGRKGGGNPALKGDAKGESTTPLDEPLKVGPKVEPNVDPKEEIKPQRFRSSEVQNSENTEETQTAATAAVLPELPLDSTEGEPGIPAKLDTPEFRAAWADWLAYRRERKLPKYKTRALIGQFDALAEWGVDVAIASIRESIRQQWQGLFQPKATPGAPRSGAVPWQRKTHEIDHSKGF